MITHSAVINNACAKGRQPERELELLAEMQERGLEPDVFSTARGSAHARRDSNLNVRSSCWQ